MLSHKIRSFSDPSVLIFISSQVHKLC